MFESAELGHEIDKDRYDAEEPVLRGALLAAQYELLARPSFSVVILIAGVDGAGKGDTLNVLNEWMDPRHLETNAIRPISRRREARPPMWQFWRALPRRGEMALFVGSWYTAPLLRRVYRESSKAELDQDIDDIVRFERMLVDEGTLVLKFWLHLSKKQQRKRFARLEKHPETSWRVNDTDWQHLELYKRFQSAAEHLLRGTSTGDAPWIVVEGMDDRYRNLTIGTAILRALRDRLDREPKPGNGSGAGTGGSAVDPAKIAAATTSVGALDGRTVLQSLELDHDLAKDDYEDQLALLQGRLNRASRHKRFTKLSVVAAFEGADAGGKGGAIRRVTQALDARSYDVIPIAAPTDEEKARPYLWRFWRRVPRRGRLAIFDRSWYGRVLVERVEGFAAVADWQRAYAEINDFERQLVANDTLVVKIWLQISKEEQLRRFEERQRVAYKRHKITDEDWRNRDKWDAYQIAVCEMIDRTSTEYAPWTLIGANNKHHARLAVLRTLVEAIEARL
jgi:AMP-polyphosphate phosphotransferase